MVHRPGFDFPFSFVLHEYQIVAFVFNPENMIFDIEERIIRFILLDIIQHQYYSVLSTILPILSVTILFPI